MFENCPRCGIEGSLKSEIYSTQSLFALVKWGELEEGLVEKPICFDCHGELRDTLIERCEEIQTVFNQHKTAATFHVAFSPKATKTISLKSRPSVPARAKKLKVTRRPLRAQASSKKKSSVLKKRRRA